MANRLLIHAGDWHKYLQERKQPALDLEDLPAGAADAFIHEIEKRKATEQARKPRD
jgi:hypothetical protein